MFHLNRLSRVARHVLTFVLHFAHGSIVMAGVLVVGFIGYQIAHYGTDGLNARQLLGLQAAEQAEQPLAMAAQEPEPVAEVQPQMAGLSPAYVRVTQAIAKRHKLSPLVVETLVKAAQREGKANGIDPLLILAVVTVESGFNPYAESVFGAQGLMQVIPKFHQDKISADLGETALFDPAENIRVGTRILKEYLRLNGSMEAALQNYGGANNDPDMQYANRVLAEQQRLKQISASAAARTTARAATQTASVL